MDVLGDVYPYNAGSTKLDNMMPAWAHDGGIGKLLERLADRATRRRIVEECLIDGEQWGTVTSEAGSGGDIGRTRSVGGPLDEPAFMSGRAYAVTGDKHFGSGFGVTDRVLLNFTEA